MIFFLKSWSRSVHEEEQHLELQEETNNNNINDGAKCTTLTVWRKSLVISCSGFTVINSDGDLAYRVDNYSCHPEELILMNASGKSILTMRRRRKKLGLVDSWLIYEGEEAGDHSSTTSIKFSKKISRPMWSVRKHINMNILQGNNNNVLAHVFRGISETRHSYVIEGSYVHRSCKVLDVSRRVVAEIRRKEATTGGVSFGVDVFVLVVQPGLDPGFAMALVLLLDQMFC